MGSEWCVTNTRHTETEDADLRGEMGNEVEVTEGGVQSEGATMGTGLAR